MVALPLYDSTLEHFPARLGLATGRELSSASPAAAAQALPQSFRHMASPAFGDLGAVAAQPRCSL